MKHLIALGIAGSLLASCSGPTHDPDTTSAQDSATTQADTLSIDAEWPGYYTGMFDNMEVTLWVRNDSTFIIQQLHDGDDNIPQGAIGQWHVVRSEAAPGTHLLSMQYGGDPPDHYLRTATGLVFVDLIGGYDVVEDWKLERLTNEIGDAIPRMRIKGTYVYETDAQSFKPCGSNYTWPCVGGMDTVEEEGEALETFTSRNLQKAYAKAVKKGGLTWLIEAVCTMGMGPAMEGDGADEYFFIELPPRTAKRCP